MTMGKMLSKASAGLVGGLFYAATISQALATSSLLMKAGNGVVGGSAPYVPLAVHMDTGLQMTTSTPVSPDSCNYALTYWHRTNWLQAAASYQSDGDGPGWLTTLPNSSEGPRGIYETVDNSGSGNWRFAIGVTTAETLQSPGFAASATTIPLATGLPAIFNFGGSDTTVIEDNTIFPSGNPAVSEIGHVVSTGYNSGTGVLDISAATHLGTTGDTILVDNFANTVTPGSFATAANVPWAGVWAFFVYTANVCTNGTQSMAAAFVQNQNGTIANTNFITGGNNHSWWPSSAVLPFTSFSQGFAVNTYSSTFGGSYGDYADVMLFTGCDALNSGNNGIDPTTMAAFVNTSTGAPINPSVGIAFMRSRCSGTPTAQLPAIEHQGPASNWTTEEGGTSITNWTLSTNPWGFPLTDLYDGPAGIPAHEIALQWQCSTITNSSGLLTAHACGNRINSGDFILNTWSLGATSLVANTCTITASTVSGATAAVTSASGSGTQVTIALTTPLTAPTVGPTNGSPAAGQFVGWDVTLSGFSATGGTAPNGTFVTQAGSTASSIIINSNATGVTVSSGVLAWASGNASSSSPFVPWFNVANTTTEWTSDCVAYKWANSTDVSVATSYTATSGINGAYSAQMVSGTVAVGTEEVDYGQSGGLPISVDVAGVPQSSLASSSSLVAPSISPTNANGNDLLVNVTLPWLAFYGAYTCPSGSIERARQMATLSPSNNTVTQTIICDEIITASGATGTRTVTQTGSLNASVSRSYVAGLIALEPN
jgi:hypothetical protein